MNTATAFAPGHVTGFFSIADDHPDPLKKGSRGAGFCLAKGVTTTIQPLKTRDDSVLIDGVLSEAPVSRRVLGLFWQRTGLSPRGVEVDHRMEIPVGSGFGSSGAGALSLALALNKGAGSPLNLEEAAQLAHQAEVECGTGLGTIMGETYGRFEIRLEPGAPGVGTVALFPGLGYDRAVFCHYGPLSTKHLLKDPGVRQKIIHAGAPLTAALLQNPTPENFLKLSSGFARQTGLLTPELEALLDWAEEQGVPGSMLMFGNGLFFLMPSRITPEFIQSLSLRAPGARIFESALDNQGAR